MITSVPPAENAFRRTPESPAAEIHTDETKPGPRLHHVDEQNTFHGVVAVSDPQEWEVRLGFRTSPSTLMNMVDGAVDARGRDETIQELVSRDDKTSQAVVRGRGKILPLHRRGLRSRNVDSSDGEILQSRGAFENMTSRFSTEETAPLLKTTRREKLTRILLLRFPKTSKLVDRIIASRRFYKCICMRSSWEPGMESETAARAVIQEHVIIATQRVAPNTST
ncbi:hypothetical protein DFH07DRAFT_784910 [Mycena maculata]|uniref:Uncharacterized protein n=1 Tax=Mycena maculata TaxID=230809 RepID=A0AAD7HFF0_9AGAR|nr:hypothetical protein DFH07DRAFT_784910 [Mycena maculata]